MTDDTDTGTDGDPPTFDHTPDVRHTPPDELGPDGKVTDEHVRDAVGFGRERDRVVARYLVRVPGWLIDRLAEQCDDPAIRAAKNAAVQRFREKHDCDTGGYDLLAERKAASSSPTVYDVWIVAE